MENECDYSFEDIKKKYQYDINNCFDYENLSIELSFICYDGVCHLVKKLNKVIANLNEYKGASKKEAENYLKKMTDSLQYFENQKKKISKDVIYFTRIIGNMKVHLKSNWNIKTLKEICIKNIKTVLDSQVHDYIKVDKNIINCLNLIKDITLVFNF